MMKTYARVDNGVVQEIIQPLADPEGGEYPIEERFTPDLLGQMVDITGRVPPPASMWTYDGAVFAAPVPYQPSPEIIKSVNTSTRDDLLAKATLAIAPLQDAVDLDVATPEETLQLTSWKYYRVAVNRVDLTQNSPSWPPQP